MIKKNLGGKERGFTFNNYAISVISEKSKGSNSMAFLYAVVYGGMSGYDYAKEIEQDYSFSDVIEWVDTAVNDGETFADVITEMQNSQQFKKLQENGEKKTGENLPAES